MASFSVGVPPGPTGRDNQTGQLQTDGQMQETGAVSVQLAQKDPLFSGKKDISFLKSTRIAVKAAANGVHSKHPMTCYKL